MFVMGTTNNLTAQDFKTGSQLLNAGVDLGFGFYSSNKVQSVSYIPISVSIDYGIREDIGPGVLGIGAFAGISGGRDRYIRSSGIKYGYNYTNLMFGPRATYHYNFVDEVKTYAGLLIAASLSFVREVGDFPVVYNGHTNIFNLYPSLFIGGRYYFRRDMALFGELGIGFSVLKLGLTINLN